MADRRSKRERFAGAFVDAAPLLGIGVWAWRLYAIDSVPHADYDSSATFFSAGLFMLAVGLVVAAVAFFAARSPASREHGWRALRFQLWTLGVCIALAAVATAPALLAALANKHAYTFDNQPQGLVPAIAITAFAFGIALPLLQAVRAIVAPIRSLTSGDAP